MKEITPGVLYRLEPFHQPHPTFEEQYLRFLHREPVGEDKILVTKMNGTTLTSVLEACKGCLDYLNHQLPCEENLKALENIERAIDYLEERRKDRRNRGVLGKHLL